MLLAMHNIHRLFIVDGKSNPIGVLSITDVFRLLTTPQVVLRMSGSEGLGDALSRSFADEGPVVVPRTGTCYDMLTGTVLTGWILSLSVVAASAATDPDPPLTQLFRGTTSQAFMFQCKSAVRIDGIVDVIATAPLKSYVV